jgi:sugar/nucleoside kinase (ribokinase family)
MVPDRGANARWRAEELPQDVLASADLLHVVGYVLLDESSQVGALEAMRIARRHGVAISLDPSSHGPLLGRGVEGFLRLAGQVDLLLPNRSEAAVLTAAVTPEDAAEALLCIAGCVAIKLDRDGCLGAVPGERCRVPAPPAPVANATGAGDAFDAGFLRSWVSGRDLVAACRSGVSLGAFAVTLDSTR